MLCHLLIISLIHSLFTDIPLWQKGTLAVSNPPSPEFLYPFNRSPFFGEIDNQVFHYYASEILFTAKPGRVLRLHFLSNITVCVCLLRISGHVFPCIPTALYNASQHNFPQGRMYPVRCFHRDLHPGDLCSLASSLNGLVSRCDGQ